MFIVEYIVNWHNIGMFGKQYTCNTYHLPVSYIPIVNWLYVKLQIILWLYGKNYRSIAPRWRIASDLRPTGARCPTGSLKRTKISGKPVKKFQTHFKFWEKINHLTTCKVGQNICIWYSIDYLLFDQRLWVRSPFIIKDKAKNTPF